MKHCDGLAQRMKIENIDGSLFRASSEGRNTGVTEIDLWVILPSSFVSGKSTIKVEATVVDKLQQ